MRTKTFGSDYLSVRLCREEIFPAICEQSSSRESSMQRRFKSITVDVLFALNLMYTIAGPEGRYRGKIGACLNLALGFPALTQVLVARSTFQPYRGVVSP